MPTLFDIAAQFKADAAKLHDLDLDEATLADTLEGMTGELEAKAQNVAFVARNLEALAASIKEAETAMDARRKALENRANGLRRYIADAMDFAGVRKIECPYFALKLKANPASVDVFDLAQLPMDYMCPVLPPPPAPDKAAIKAALQAGQDVPGARLVQGQRLEIK